MAADGGQLMVPRGLELDSAIFEPLIRNRFGGGGWALIISRVEFEYEGDAMYG